MTTIRRILVAAAIMLLVVSGHPQAMDLPDAPDGFTWKKLKPVKAAVLIPDGWHFKKQNEKGTLAYFLTRENIDESGIFLTGLSINIFRDRPNFDAVDYARSYIATIIDTHEPIQEPFTSEAGPLKGFGVQVNVPGDDTAVDTIMHYLAIGNSETNTLYVFFFESPAAEWDTAWVIGETMLQIFVLDDEI